VGISLADAVGEHRPQNLPGTITQYPNWCVPLGDGDERPVLLEDLAAHPGVRAVAEAVSQPLGGRVPGSAVPARPRPGPR
jgi:4-alpha-glucanotransferase